MCFKNKLTLAFFSPTFLQSLSPDIGKSLFRIKKSPAKTQQNPGSAESGESLWLGLVQVPG